MANGMVGVVGPSWSTTCRSCGETISWWTTSTGKQIPFTGKPIPTQRQDLLGPVFELPAALGHFVTCPDAPHWRKKERHHEA